MICANRKIIVASNSELRNIHYYRRLWIAVRNIRLPRRKWLDEISFSILRFRGDIVYPNDTPFGVPDIDEVFSDQNMRWMSYFLLEKENGLNPRLMSRKLERLRLLDLYMKIEKPAIARHFGR